MKRKAAAVFLTIALLAACAGPNVDRTAPHFDHETYFTDLNNCRGGSAVEAAVETTAVGLWGSLVGAYHGLRLGWAARDSAEAVLVGAVVGAGIGVGVGAVKSVREFNGEVADCLRVKGYAISREL